MHEDLDDLSEVPRNFLERRPLGESFPHDSYFYYHLGRHADFVERELSKCLSAPSPDDVLDAVVRDDPATETASERTA